MTEPVGPAEGGEVVGWEAFEPLYDEHHERLYRIALLLCHGSEAMAEDAVTETFLRVYADWAAGRVTSFFPHARQTLVSHVMGEVRAPDLEPHDRGARPDGASIAGAASTFQLLEQLAPDERTAVVLRYFEDLSYEQIATTMGIPVGEAKAEVSVGMQRMRALMGERS